MTTTKLWDVLQVLGILALAILYLWFIVALTFKGDGKGTYYNCTLAEISPDFPIEAKELCRKKQSGRI
jgi:hypothetical protein